MAVSDKEVVRLENLLLAHGLKEHSIAGLFTEIAEKYPHNTALIFNGKKMSYHELNCHANQLAHFLLQKGVENKFIGLFVEPSFEMIIGLLGILKSGLAYVPIDTKNAPERIRTVIEDLSLDTVLTSKELIDKLPDSEAELICFDEYTQILSRQNNHNPQLKCEGKDIAYVIYTSGSTGKPKGVPICHYNVISLFRASDQLFDFSDKDIWTLFHSISFDFSVWEVWGALLKGGKLVIVPYSVSRNMGKFYDLLVKENVTVLNQTPTSFRMLIQTDKNRQAIEKPSLRYVILGGEALNIQSLEPWFEKYGEMTPQIINMYGITETTVHVTYRQITLTDLNSKESLIGNPLPDLQVYLLDDNLNPVPYGEVGEIYVEGLGLSPGYINQEKLTKEKFIQNPFLNIPGRRLYKTGDLGMFAPNGELAYVGRIDNQVQVRGYRIELGEIESALISLDNIEDGIATVQGDVQSDPKIVVYYKAKDGEIISNKVLRESLNRLLPDYMLPNISILVDHFPLNKNGKLDLNQLPSPFAAEKNKSLNNSPDTLNEGITDKRKALSTWKEFHLHCWKAGLH